MGKARSPKKRAAPPAAASEIVVRSSTTSLSTAIPRAVARELARRWYYVMRQRRRWARPGALSNGLQREVEGSLTAMGLSKEKIAALTGAELIEVSLPFEREEDDYEVRIVPWEFLLREALRPEHPHRLLIVRHLRTSDRTRAKKKNGERPLLRIIESSPGAIEHSFAFDFERQLVASSLGVSAEPDGLTLFDPAPERMREWLARSPPSVLHVTGVDTREGAELARRVDQAGADALLLEPWRRPVPSDGMLVSKSGHLAHLDYRQLGEIAGFTGPDLVSYNFYRSGLRIAAATVRAGAGASLGFLDSFDDALAEVFLCSYYRSWARHRDAHAAFVDAWTAIDAHPQRRTLKGTGIVLWSRRSAFERSRPVRAVAKPRRVAEPKGPARAMLAKPEIRPLRALNYSLMHNERGLFERFRLALHPGKELRDVSVHVELHAGTERAEYRTSVDLSQTPVDLASRVHVPLTAPLARLADERIVSSIFVSVAHKDEQLHTDSYRVSLLPLDEWRDDDRDRQWLPCFVLPRDPTVARLVGRAQRYLRTLADDVGASFDGYQRGDDDHVDHQAAAIWNTIVHEFPIDYANPPPTYTEGAQRLRTPTDVIETRLGTCIDLSLLLAACFEYVDIHPAIFLMRGHSFVGYWRSLEARQKYFEAPFIPDAVETGRSFVGDDRAPAWVSGRDAYCEVRDRVRAGDLVPIEATWLPLRRGFAEAVTAGENNVESQVDFDALIDIVAARVNEVTPLPFTWREPHGEHG